METGNHPDPYPSGLDPAHILAICAQAAPGHRRDTVLVVGGRHAAQVYLPDRAAGRAAQAALGRVGYQADRATGGSRGRHLIIHGWGAGALEARLVAMRAVLEQLAADPASMATTVLEQLRGVPEAELPGQAGQQQLVAQAAAQLRRWIFRSSGIHAPHDPRVRPADPGCGLRVSATWQLEEAIDDVAARLARVAGHALDLYPALRPQVGHDGARDSAVRQASITFHLRSSPVAQDTSPLLRSPGRDPGTAAAEAAPGTQASATGRPGSRAAREFPVTSTAASRLSSTGPAGPPGRNFPSGRTGRHP
jgi:hypothetical protein